MRRIRVLGSPLEIRSALLFVPLALLLSLPVALATDHLGGWGTLAALLGVVAVLAAIGVALRLSAWRHPFSWQDLSGDAVVKGFQSEVRRQRFSPVEVEQALHCILVEWARRLADSGEATVLFHRHAHADYDVRIVDPDGGEAGTRVCLIQAKARPVPATLRRFAAVREREDAHEAVLFTVRLSLEQATRGSLAELAVTQGIRLAAIDELDGILRGHDPTVEIFAEPEPPGALVPALAEI